jgi:lambda repressor-like predicted transcriptional regulator
VLDQLPVPQKRVTPVSPADQVKITAAYQHGASITELAAELGLTRLTVSATLRRLGVPMRPRHSPTEEELERAVELYERGWSLAKIGKELGYDSKIIWRRLSGRVQMRAPWEHPELS